MFLLKKNQSKLEMSTDYTGCETCMRNCCLGH